MPCVGIDTNIFLHLLNPDENVDAHIDKLLAHLSKMQYRLLVDSTRKISNEYQQMLVPMIKNMDETRAQLPLLRFWMSVDIRQEVALNRQDALMRQIEQVIQNRDEHVDRAFVYVVCSENAVLITNDRVHILNLRRELLRKTRRHRGRDTAIQSSNEAIHHFIANGEPS